MIRTAVDPQVYESKEELHMLLHKGMLLNGGKTWFSLNKNDEHCEMIYAAVCLIPILPPSPKYAYSSLFPEGRPLCWRFKMHVKPQFLSPGVTYAVNLVFNFDNKSMDLLFLNYKLAEETHYSTAYIANEREGGWLMAELYQFTSVKTSADLNITFDCQRHPLRVEGIEFRPVERVEHQEDEEVDMPETYWDQKLPSDYKGIIKRSKDRVQWTTKKELYSILCKGFPISNGEEWFSLAENGKKCHMLPARMVLRKSEWSWGSLPESRFKEVASFTQKTFLITCISKTLPLETRYASYLVYNIQTKNIKVGQVVEVSDRGWITKSAKYDPQHIPLFLPQTPIIGRKVKDNTKNPLNRTHRKGVPQQRNDGWMEVYIGECQTGYYTSDKALLDLYLNLKSFSRIKGFVVQGIDFKVI